MKNKLKLIFLADTHLGFDYPVRPRIERRRRGYDFFNNFKKVLKYAIRSKADLIVHGGDFFFRSRVPKKVIDTAYEILLKFADYDIPIFIVPGNHERSRLPAAELLAHPNIFIFDRPRSFLLENGQRLVLAGFPYYKKNVRSHFKKILNRTDWQNYPADFRILCFHHAIEGATVGPSNYTFLHGNDVIKVEDLPPEFPLVLSGHIHRRQMRVKDDENGKNAHVVAYAGSIERTSFAEKAEPKGFYEFVIGKGITENWRIHNFRFIELPARPMVDLYLNKQINHKTLKHNLRAAVSEFHPDSIVRLKADGTLDKEVLEMLSAPYLREVFPKSINFQLSLDLFD